jgi:hypothetical protein
MMVRWRRLSPQYDHCINRQPACIFQEKNRNSMTTKPKAPVPPTPKPQAPPPAPNPRQAEDLRWQRTVRFNWDNGGKRGGNKDGRK